MKFNINHPILFLLAGIIVLAVLGQSLYFLRKAWKRAKEIGMPMDKLKRVAFGTAIFTIAPALAIVISVISLSKKLGIPLPWMRLSVVGAITYETPAAANALSAMGLEWAELTELTATQYVTVAAVMTMGIMVGIWLVPLGYVFDDFTDVFRGDLHGLIPPLVFFVSAAMMGVCGLALKKLKWTWMNDYALPISLLVGMVSAIPITAWLG